MSLTVAVSLTRGTAKGAAKRAKVKAAAALLRKATQGIFLPWENILMRGTTNKTRRQGRMGVVVCEVGKERIFFRRKNILRREASLRLTMSRAGMEWGSMQDRDQGNSSLHRRQKLRKLASSYRGEASNEPGTWAGKIFTLSGRGGKGPWAVVLLCVARSRN